MKTKKNAILLVAIVAVIVVFLSYVSNEYLKNKKEQEAVQNMCQRVKETVPKGITKEKYYQDEQYIEDINCVSLCNLSLDALENCYVWTDGYYMTFKMNDSFDKLTDAQRYEIIKRVGQSAFTVYREERDKQYPQYLEYQKKYDYNEDLFGKLLMVSGGEEKVCFQTSANTYEYASHVDDYYIKNDEEVFIRNEDGYWHGFGSIGNCIVCGKPAYYRVKGKWGGESLYCDECYEKVDESVKRSQYE